MKQTKRLIKDESGMTMALAVIMVALLGVLGAGLLVFATSDLTNVVESNQGQRAFEMADAGVQAARRELIRDSDTDSYDEDGDSEWALVNDGVILENLYTDGDGTATVTIKSQDDPQDIFKVLSEGTYGNAKRIIEAEFKEVSTTGGNTGSNYIRTPETISLSGNLNLKNMVTYSGKNTEANGILSLDSSDIFVDGTFEFEGNLDIEGNSLLGDWKNSFNPTARSSELSGIAARTLDLSGTGIANKKGSQFFDSSTTPAFSSSKVTGKVTFPFDTTLEPDIDMLRSKASEQGNLESADNSYTLTSWPADSTQDTVVFIDFTGAGFNTFNWNVPGTCTDNKDAAKGTLVLYGADWTRSGGAAKRLYGGLVIKQRPGDASNQHGYFTSSGVTCIGGSIFADNAIRVSGNLSGIAEPTPNLPSPIQGPSRIESRSWRECYSEDCSSTP